MQILLFSSSDEEYGLQIEGLKIILEVEHICRVPKAPEYILGVINHRGRIITIIDLALLMGLQKTNLDSNSRIIVLDSDLVEVGLMVSHVYDFYSVSMEQLKELPAQTGSDRDDRFVQKMVEYNTSVISIVDKKRLENYLYELML
ncbi:chemotaxis protein CheW [bacterium]|nr:chemotaxis protein CheW [bacterium]